MLTPLMWLIRLYIGEFQHLTFEIRSPYEKLGIDCYIYLLAKSNCYTQKKPDSYLFQAVFITLPVGFLGLYERDKNQLTSCLFFMSQQ